MKASANAEPACLWSTTSCTNSVAAAYEMGIEISAAFMLLVPALTCGFGGLEGEAACTNLAADGMGCVWTGGQLSSQLI